MSLGQQGASLTDTDYANFPVVIPDSLKFTSVKQGLPARRIPIKIRAEQPQYASNNNKLMRIIFPNNSLIDTRAGYLRMTVTVTKTGGTYARIHDGIFSIINRLRILASSSEIEDLQDYNRIYAALWEMTNPTLVTSNIASIRMGFGTQAQRNAMITSFEYILPLWSGVLNTELMPFDNLSNGFELQLYLEDATMCIETDGTVPIITVSALEFHVERLELDSSYRSFIKSYIGSNGLNLGYHTWQRYVNTLTTGTRQDIQINHKSSSMNGMLNFFINSSTLNSTTTNDRFLDWITLSLQQTNTMINQQVFPDEPIDIATAGAYEAYQMYCRWLKKWKLDCMLEIAPPINSTVYNTNRFVQIDDFEPYPELDNIVNPFSTLKNNATIIKKLVFPGAIAANMQLDTWIEFFRQILITTDGSVKVIQ